MQNQFLGMLMKMEWFIQIRTCGAFFVKELVSKETQISVVSPVKELEEIMGIDTMTNQTIQSEREKELHAELEKKMTEAWPDAESVDAIILNEEISGTEQLCDNAITICHAGNSFRTAVFDIDAVPTIGKNHIWEYIWSIQKSFPVCKRYCFSLEENGISFHVQIKFEC